MSWLEAKAEPESQCVGRGSRAGRSGCFQASSSLLWLHLSHRAGLRALLSGTAMGAVAGAGPAAEKRFSFVEEWIPRSVVSCELLEHPGLAIAAR